ncbi:Epsin-like protein, partial [Globisporangium splendens]
MDRLRAALDEVIDKVKLAIRGEPKSPVEILLDQHLPLYDDVVLFSPKNCCAVAIPMYVMNDFASRTHNIVDYPSIMSRIWDILLDAQHDPNLMKKDLNLLHYLLANGSIQVLKDCQDSVRMHFFDELGSDYNRVEFDQYKFSKHLDIGAGVRKTASEISHLAVHERELFHVRRTAQKLHQSLSDRGLRSAYPSPKGEERTADSTSCSSDSLSFRDERQPPKYTDSLPMGPMWEDDLASKIVTHTESALDEAKDESPYGSRHSSGSSRTSSTSSTSSRSTDSSRVSRRESKSMRQEPSFTTTSVDLLGLDAFLSPTESTTTTRLQCDAANDIKSRTRSHQKLVATI